MKIKITKLDRLFSKYIRERDGWTCQKCTRVHLPPTSALHCSHFFGRRKKSVRWEPKNCVALCMGCHAYFTGNPLAHTEWFREYIGEKEFDKLTLKANTAGMPDLKMIELWLKEKLKEME